MPYSACRRIQALLLFYILFIMLAFDCFSIPNIYNLLPAFFIILFTCSSPNTRADFTLAIKALPISKGRNSCLSLVKSTSNSLHLDTLSFIKFWIVQSLISCRRHIFTGQSNLTKDRKSSQGRESVPKLFVLSRNYSMSTRLHTPKYKSYYDNCMV